MRFDDTFANGKYIEGGDAYPARWVKSSAEFRDSLGGRAHLGLTYGPDPSHWYDLFLPKAEPLGLMVFVHGGYWLAFGPRDFSHLAAGPLARGWAVAMPAYTLAPAARISAMTQEIAMAVETMAERIAGPIVITGHSAGGHLSARMASADVARGSGLAGRIKRVMPISPLSDLRPLIETTMNDTLHLDMAEAYRESPALQPPCPKVPVHVWVGGAERPAFLDQARRLGNAWACPVTVDPDRHHFDVIEGLETPDSALLSTLLA